MVEARTAATRLTASVRHAPLARARTRGRLSPEGRLSPSVTRDLARRKLLGQRPWTPHKHANANAEEDDGLSSKSAAAMAPERAVLPKKLQGACSCGRSSGLDA